MHQRALFLVVSLSTLILFFAVGAPVLAEEPGHAPPRIAHLLQGTSYERLLEQAGDSSAHIADKGFLPNLGNYFDPSSEGWGLDIQALGDVIFAVWFTYNLDGTPTWYIIVGTPTAGDKGMSITGNIESFKWDPFGDPGAQATATIVGTMNITWSDASNAEVSWTLDGEPGSASIQFIRFAPAPTPSNMTGHYFDQNRPGWGFTTLTQGEVSVVTVYWYKNGQPVWAQGVVTRPGFFGSIDLLYFTGPGLCPSCLAKDAPKGPPATESLSNLFFDWLMGDPPLMSMGETIFGPEDGPLGPDPFDDIVFPAVADAITSVAGDNFDPEYADFIDAILGARGEKGPDCIVFEYDSGIVDAAQSHTFLSAYFKLEPDEGMFPMFSDAGCTQPFLFTRFGAEQTAPTGLMLAWTGEEGAVYKWSASFPPVEKGGQTREEGLQNSIAVVGGKGSLFNILYYGVGRYILIDSGGDGALIPVTGISPESLANIEQFPDDLLFARFIYP